MFVSLRLEQIQFLAASWQRPPL